MRENKFISDSFDLMIHIGTGAPPFIALFVCEGTHLVPLRPLRFHTTE